MKKQILVSALVGALAVSSASAWNLFGDNREKPNYDYSGDKEFIQKNTQKLGTNDAKDGALIKVTI